MADDDTIRWRLTNVEDDVRRRVSVERYEADQRHVISRLDGLAGDQRDMLQLQRDAKAETRRIWVTVLVALLAFLLNLAVVWLDRLVFS